MITQKMIDDLKESNEAMKKSVEELEKSVVDLGELLREYCEGL